MQKAKKWMKPWHVGPHLVVLSKRYPMNTNMTGFQKSLHPRGLDESSFSIDRVKRVFCRLTLNMINVLGLKLGFL